MAVKISTRGRYALRLMLDLALHDTGEYISLRDISARQEISVKYLEQIVTVLGRVPPRRQFIEQNATYATIDT